MKYLIYGAGTIGITYGWLLSQNHEIDLLVKPEHYEKLSGGVVLSVKDLRKKASSYENVTFYPSCVTEVTDHYDGILVTVNRCQLAGVLPRLSELAEYTKYFAFMQNNWNIQAELEAYLSADQYLIAFPSSTGGGRDEAGLKVILFDEAVRLGGKCRAGLGDIQTALNQSGIRTVFDKNIFDWMKVHYLQQSVTAGAVLECGGYGSFASDYQAVKKVVRAFREGIGVCRMQGVDTNKTFPAGLFKLPTFVAAHIMQNMFLEANTREMVENHMKKGLPEWAAGYQEILNAGTCCGLPMTVWRSYDEAVEKYCLEQTLKC